ncbi:MAG TPA: cytidine deaminase [Clostridiaceae bacterium]|nr:cytidine deaminase [Clostridiaceae bacterium]
MNNKELVRLAQEIEEKAYAPYSGFRVGAALLTGNDRVFLGVNIENASFGATNCAERTAIFKAVSEGEKRIKAIAIASDSDDFVFPCGICRQVIAEFSDIDTKIICSRKDGEYKVYTLKELLPHAFTEINTGGGF